MPNTYIAEQGDSFDAIAFNIWGNEKLMHHLVLANLEKSKVLFFKGGEVLEIPEIDLKEEKGPVPPWESQ